jgi:hypothetical protein
MDYGPFSCVLSLEKKRSAEQLGLVIDDSTLGIARAACWPRAALWSKDKRYEDK